MTYVTMREDKFGRLKSKIAKLSANDKVNSSSVRRPLHGMELLEDTYATITVRTAGGRALNVLADTSTPEIGVYGRSSTTNLIVQRVDESRQEKQQIIETFGEDFVYYYGQRPRMLQVNAILPDSLEFQYAQEFWTNYDRALRGTKLVTRDARVFLDVAGQIFEGYLSTAQTSRSADQPRIIQLNFTMYITHSYYVRPLDNRKLAESHRNPPPNTLSERKYFTYKESMLGDYLRLPSTTEIELEDDPFVSAKSLMDRVFTRDVILMLVKRVRSGEVKVYDYVGTLQKKARQEAMSFAMPEVGSTTFGAKAVPESNLSKFLSGASKALSVAAGGLIVQGAIGAVVDGVNEEGGIEDYFNNRILNPILDEIDTFITDSKGILTGLIDAGYSIVEPDKPLSESDFFTVDKPTAEQSASPDNPSPIAVTDPEVLVFITAPTSSSSPTPSGQDVVTYPNDDTFTDRLIL